ncbi:MAG: Rne/Rng family ribonuclease [Acidobacteriota bacterium]
MTKEMIISANLHEKKVAILEDGVVTEFYVERKDQNQGVVGNLYKGRVMKVLPGMQSAFVNIGLERDAFLYVSDFTEFMEEEDEIDFREAAEEPRPRRDDRRGQRGRQPLVEPVEEPEVAVELEDVVEQLAEIADESGIIPPPEEEKEGEAIKVPTSEAEVLPVEDLIAETALEPIVEEAGIEEAVEEIPAEEAAGEAAEKPRRGRGRRPSARSKKKEEPEPVEAGRRRRRSARPSVEEEVTEEATEEAAEESQFERVTDEDLEQETGELLKDALVQEKIFEQIHTAEYQTIPGQVEPEPEWRVGSFRSQLKEQTSFERVIDESAPEEEAVASLGTPVVTHFAEAVAEEEAVAPFRHIADVIPFDLMARAEEAESATEEAESKAEAAGESPESEATETTEDREAEVRDRRGRAEFALRRGGRGRRRGPRRGGEGQDKSRAPAGEEEGEEATAEAAAKEGEPRYEEEPVAPRPESRRRGGPPSISELLHEGQEVLVQIAKEPIAKKGARITSHIALPGRYLVYMPTVNHVGVSRKIPSEIERVRLKRTVAQIREREGAAGGFIARTACAGHTEQELLDDMRYLIRTWADIRKKSDRVKSPALVHRDLDLVQRILRDHLSDEFTAIRVDNDLEYARMVEFVNRVQPKLVKRVKLYTGDQPIFDKYSVQPEIDKAVKPRVWLKSGGYIVINQTEALVAIDVNTGKFVGKSDRLEDTITKTNLEAAKEIVRQIRLRDLGGIIVIDFIDMEERKNRQKVMMALQVELQSDRSPSKILSINDFGLVAITRKRVKQSLERTLCTPCPYCQGAGMVKSPQTMCFEILEQTKAISKQVGSSSDVILRCSPDVAEAFRTTEKEVFEEIEAYFGGPVTIEADPNLHQEQYDFAIM